MAGGGLASQAAQQGRAVADLLFMNRYLGKANAILQRSTPMEDVLDDDFFTQNEDAEFEESSEIDDKSSLFGSKVGISAPLTLWTIPEIARYSFSTNFFIKLKPLKSETFSRLYSVQDEFIPCISGHLLKLYL